MEQVSFKVTLTEKVQESSKSQVRRFEVPQDCSTSYIYLKEKLRSLFGQELGNSGIKITWKDQDDDIITIESDEELIIAMHEMKGPIYKFCIESLKVKANLFQKGYFRKSEYPFFCQFWGEFLSKFFLYYELCLKSFNFNKKYFEKKSKKMQNKSMFTL